MKRKNLKIKLILGIGAAAATLPIAAVSCFKELTPEEKKFNEYKRRYINAKNYVFDDFEDFTVNKAHVLYPKTNVADDNFVNIYNDFNRWYDDFSYKFKIFRDVIKKYGPEEIKRLKVHYTKEVKINLNPHDFKDGDWNYSLFEHKDVAKWVINKDRFIDMLVKILNLPNLNTNIAVSGLDMLDFDKARKSFVEAKIIQDGHLHIVNPRGYWSKLTFSSDFWKQSYDKNKNDFNPSSWEWLSDFDAFHSSNFYELYLKPKLMPGMKDNGFNADSHSITLKSYEDDEVYSIWYPRSDKDLREYPRYILYEGMFKFKTIKDDPKIRWHFWKFLTETKKKLYYVHDYTIQSYENKELFSDFEFKNEEGAKVKEILNPWKNADPSKYY
ncbi:hypothetical protein DA803_02645 [[Mycoplasma] phocae]|uniref:Lipoprotein n=1 Tax=[Mycoplasma] phocae TaxID=142651 RepID=A0A2Z5ISV7_9BACT|nr:hypothetical protein [[Mycoplasma] phocae]AXE60968.1 hypothetical protein DA803_02645 [[Mycoplasma] phocae]